MGSLHLTGIEIRHSEFPLKKFQISPS